MKRYITLIMSAILIATILIACKKVEPEFKELPHSEWNAPEKEETKLEEDDTSPQEPEVDSSKHILEEHYTTLPDGTEVLTDEGYLAVAETALDMLEEVKERPENATVVTPQEMLLHINNETTGNFLVSDYPYYKSLVDEIYPMVVYRPVDEDNYDPLSEKYEYIKATGEGKLWGNLKKYDKYIYWELYRAE